MFKINSDWICHCLLLEIISWIDRVINEKVLQRVKEDKTILQTIRKRKANWIGNILPRNCCLKRAVEGKMREG